MSDGMTNTRAWAPWTPEQVAKLREWQACGWVHPYTCPEGQPLVPSREGWTCLTCAYRQLWCWAPMLNGPPPNPVEAFTEGFKEGQG